VSLSDRTAGALARHGALSTRRALLVVALFAAAYFLSALVRAVTATLAPTLAAEFALTPADLGLLAGAYFLGFAVPQLLLGHWLDSVGPQRVLVGFLGVAVVGCAAFAMADGRWGLVAARAAIGVGVCACLMAPLTAYRHWFSSAWQMRLNAWMLMTGSTGMLASTLPVQWLLPWVGWRGVFWALAGLFAVALVAIAALVPGGRPGGRSPAAAGTPPAAGYGSVLRHPAMVAMAPLAFVLYGGMIAIQTLWAGPWMTQVQGRSPAEAAQGLFLINLTMLCTFAVWGVVTPWLARRHLHAPVVMRAGLPLALAALVGCAWAGPAAGASAWALFCALCSVVSLSQPYVGQAVDVRQAGRALSAFNLMIFAGVFVVQWSIGLAVSGLKARGWSDIDAFRGAMGALAGASMLAYLWFLRTGFGPATSSHPLAAGATPSSVADDAVRQTR
jgi:predicted MFS family arabinose efflux permease